MFKFLGNIVTIIILSLTILFFSTAASVIIIGPHGDMSKENVLLTTSYILSFSWGVAANILVNRYIKK